MSVIYIGSIYSTGMIDSLKSMGSSIDYAAETFQTSLLQGLCEYYPHLKVVTASNISTYPRVKRLSFLMEEFSLPFSQTKHIFTGFINIPGIKHISKCIRVRKALKCLLDKSSDNTIIIYGVHSPFLLSLRSIRKRRYKSCLIVPDLPDFMSESRNFFYLFGKKIDRWFIKIGMRNIDSFVLFSPHMQERLPVNNKPWIHMEGIINKDSIVEGNVEKTQEKVILYTGNLKKRMGIHNLIKAFSLIPYNNYRLWIRGNGECKQMVLDSVQNDNRIIYFESMSRHDLLQLQKRATVLVNPVYPSQQFTKYFFPSKTMEYIASGTPTIMYKLACLPREYEPHIYFFDDESVEGIKNKIIEICEKPQTELDTFGRVASEFILSEKNEKKQAKKIVELINNIK